MSQMEGFHNLRNPAVKRLMREAEELKDGTEEYYAHPLQDNLFEWHFTVRGPPNTDFDGGIYHGRISLPPDYPMKPPSIILFTPNGRFEVNRKICLSISGHHPESWQPSWSIRTALLAIIGFMPTHGNGAIGSLDYSPEERRALAIKSRNWKCAECGCLENLLKCSFHHLSDEQESSKVNEEMEKSRSLPTSTCSNSTMQNDCDTESGTLGVYKSLQGSTSYHQVPYFASDSSLAHHQNVSRQRLLTSSGSLNDNSQPALVETMAHVSTSGTHMQSSSGIFTHRICTVLMWTMTVLLVVLLIRRLVFL